MRSATDSLGWAQTSRPAVEARPAPARMPPAGSPPARGAGLSPATDSPHQHGAGQQRDRHLQVVLDAADQRPELLHGSAAASAVRLPISNGIRQSRSWACRTVSASRSVSKPVIAAPSSSTRASSWPRHSASLERDALCRGLFPGGLQPRAADPHARLAQAARQRPRRHDRRPRPWHGSARRYVR